MRRRSAVPVACQGYRSGPGTSLPPSPNLGTSPRSRVPEATRAKLDASTGRAGQDGRPPAAWVRPLDLQAGMLSRAALAGVRAVRVAPIGGDAVRAALVEAELPAIRERERTAAGEEEGRRSQAAQPGGRRSDRVRRYARSGSGIGGIAGIGGGGRRDPAEQGEEKTAEQRIPFHGSTSRRRECRDAQHPYSQEC